MIFFGEYFALMYLYIYEAKILNMEIDRYILEKFFMNEADASEISAIEAWLNDTVGVPCASRFDGTTIYITIL